MNAIEVKDLTKTFGAFTAVDHITFDVKKGEIFGFLGANGAGKTRFGSAIESQVQALWPDMTLQPKVKTSKRT